MPARSSDDAPIELVSYSPEWPDQFAREKTLLEQVLQKWLVAEVEHIGSTAVVGFSAKPIIDIMAPVRDLESSKAAIEVVQNLHYCYYPYQSDQMHWFCKPSAAVRTHHLHLVPWQSALWFKRLTFRQALRNSATLAAQYEVLKQELADRHQKDREAYTEGKSAFIASVLVMQPAIVQSAA